MLDPKSTTDILSQIEEIQKKINQTPLNFKINIDSKEFNQLATSLEKIGTSMGKALNLNTSGLDKVSVTMNTTKAGYEFLEKKVKETTNAQGQLVKEVSRFKQEVDEAGNAQTVLVKRTEETVINYKKLQQAQQKLLDDFNKKNINAIDFEIQQRELEAKQFSNLLKAQMQKEQDLKIEKQKTAEIQKQIDLYKQRMLGDNGFKGELDIFSEKQKGKYDKDALAKIRADIEALNVSTPDLNNKIKQLGNQFSSLKQQASQSGNVMTRALDNAFKFLRFYLVGGLLVGVVRAFRDATNVVVELDKSLTELNKVIDISKNEMSTFTDKAYEMGKTIGRTGKEVIDATAEFAKAGYTLEQSFELSKAALVMQNVAEGINSTEEATSSLIAVLKGYSLESTKAMQITDILNEVSNTTATNFDDLADGLRRTSGTLSQTGTSLEQLTGLLVGGFEPLRNIEQVSSGLVMISQRLRGIGEDGEAIDGLMPKLQKDFKEIANIDIIDPETNGLRSTYDILQDMARVFPTLSDKQRQYLGELAAGNRQVKVLNAILSNWQSVEGAIDSATNSMGSAMKENEKYLNSINGKISQFNSSVQMLFKNTIDSDFIKWVVDAGTAVIMLVDKIGLLPTVIGAATLAFSLFSKTAFAGTMQAAASAVASLAVKMGATIPVATGLATALAAIAPLAIVAAIYGLAKAYDALNVSMSEYQEQVNNSYNKSQSNIEQIKQLKSEYESLASKTELTREEKLKLVDIEHKLNTKFADTNESIDLQNDSLETNIQKIDELTKKEAERFTLLNERAYKASKELLDSQYVFSVSGQAGMVFDSIEDAIEHFENVLKDSTDKGNLVYNERKKVLENLYKEYDAAIDIVSKYEGYQTLLSNTVDETTQALDDQKRGLREQSKSIEELTKIYDSATDSLDDFSSSAKDLSSIFEDISNGEKLSAEQLINLITKYPQLTAQIISINNSKEEGIKITQALWDIEKQKTIDKLENDKKELESERDKLSSIKRAYEALSKVMGIVPKEIQDGLSAYDDISNRISGIGAAINELEKSTLGNYKSKSNSSKKSYTPFTEQAALKELLDADRITLQEYYNRLLALEKVQYSDYADKSAKQLEEMLRSKNEDVAKKTEAYLSLSTERKKVKTQLDTASFETSVSLLSNALSELKDSFGELSETDYDEKLANINQQTDIQQRLIKIYKDEMARLMQEFTAGNITLSDYNSRLNELESSAKEASKSIGELSISIPDILRSQVKGYKNQIDELMDAEEEAHKQRLDNIKKEKETFTDYIDHQIDELDRLKASQDYATDVAEITQAISKLQAEKNKFTLAANSGDLEAIVRVNELAEEISKKQKELSKKQSDEEYRRRKQNLQDIKKNYEEEADAKIDAENEKYNAIKNNYNKLTRTIETFTDTSISLNTNMIDNMINDYDNLSKSFTENVRYMAIAFQQQFIDKLTRAKTEITELNKLTGVSTNTSKPSGSLKHHSTLGEGFEKMSDAEFAQYVANKKAWEEGKITQAQRDYNEKLRKKYGIKVDRYSYRDLVGYYKDGGINTQTGIAMLHGTPSKPEFILNTEQMKRLVTNLAFNVAPPKYNIPKTGQKSEIRIDSLITVQGNVTKDTVPAIKNAGLDIVNKLKGLGVVINNG